MLSDPRSVTETGVFTSSELRVSVPHRAPSYCKLINTQSETGKIAMGWRWYPNECPLTADLGKQKRLHMAVRPVPANLNAYAVPNLLDNTGFRCGLSGDSRNLPRRRPSEIKRDQVVERSMKWFAASLGRSLLLSAGVNSDAAGNALPPVQYWVPNTYLAKANNII
ncbi:uncharacterized protein BT62DRAFT_999518 [Guyanagaster necrorhizus]|uniref:Uncharacterized protein n=1 Tax=Guyanagaster necrorhizus TaxID=856835 RepID=A0A9P7W379_9AGAR|nr:uncharacterized protein BT62DRAFT_999518 [Guyanagaster necrorhizus MCA 3950]KAG7451817.1 hypothetical protein BT62DRAFT_999518 [Guyanagaster necrorhizus MCA 3950]